MELWGTPQVRGATEQEVLHMTSEKVRLLKHLSQSNRMEVIARVESRTHDFKGLKLNSHNHLLCIKDLLLP